MSGDCEDENCVSGLCHMVGFCVVGFDCQIVHKDENCVLGLCHMVGFCVVGFECQEIVRMRIVCQGYVIW